MKMLIFITLLALSLAVPAFAAELKVGHFDLQKVISQSVAGKQSREKYLAKAQGFQDEINQRTIALNTLKEDVKVAVEKLKEGATVPAAIVAKDKEIAGQFRELQRLLGGYQDELKLYDAELTREVLSRLQPVIGAFAEQNKYDYLFKIAEPLVYASNKRDVTDELIKAFDKAVK